MAEAQGDDELKELNCPICLEMFESPKVLNCLHTFCEKCISKHARGMEEEGTSSAIIACPICRTPTPAPATHQTSDDWAAKLPTNSIILASMTMNQSGKDDTVYCQPCLSDDKRNICVAYCVTCSEYLCQICYDCHKKFSAIKDHTITLQAMPENQCLRGTKDGLFRCSRHMKKYTYVCLQDKDLCCSRCAITDHKNCTDLLLIESMANVGIDSLETKKVLEHLDGLRQMFLTLLENRSNNLGYIQQQKTEITQEIKTWTREVKDLTDKLETSTLEKLEQVYKQEEVTILDQIVECKSAIAAVETSKKMLLEETKADDDNAKIFMTMTKVSQQVRRYSQKHDVAQNNFQNNKIKFVRDWSLQEIIQTLNSLGQVLSEPSKIPALSPDRSYEKAMMMLPRVQLDSMVTFNARVPDDKNMCKIYSGIFLLDDRFVLCDQGNKKLKLFDKCFHCVSCLKIEDEPRFMCSVETETVAVTTAIKSIYIVSCVNKLSTLRTIDVGSNCYGIASCEQTIILDTYSKEQDSILIYDKSYNFIKRIQRPGRVKIYNKPCVSLDGEAIHCTTGNTIITIDMNGKVLNTFESNDLQDALGITIDKNGIIYCCGRKSKTVVQVTAEGRQLSVLLSRDHGLNKPFGVVLNGNNNIILICEDKSNEVKLFRLI